MGPETAKKVGYLKGLIEHFQPNDDVSRKLAAGIVDVLEELAARVDTLDDDLADLNDYVESIDDDLTRLEEDEDALDGFAEDSDFDDDGDGRVSPLLHVLSTKREAEPSDAAEDEDGEADDEQPCTVLVLCPECRGGFLIEAATPDGYDEDDTTVRYACPHCGKQVHPLLPGPGSLPTGKRV